MQGLRGPRSRYVHWSQPPPVAENACMCQNAPIQVSPCFVLLTRTLGLNMLAAPSFRRGPPKGYIQALEHRLHQVESVLAAIMSSPDIRSRSVIDELRKDELAAHILETVDAGPFVSAPPYQQNAQSMDRSWAQGISGRQKRAIDTTKDNFFSSIVADKPKVQSHRSRRESRATRENVIENVISRGQIAVLRNACVVGCTAD